MSNPVQGRSRRDPLDDILESVQKQGQGADPLDDILGGSQVTGDPLDDILGDTALMSGSSRAPVSDGPKLRERYVGAIKEIIAHPGDAIKGMAKSVLFDALKATVSPLRIGGMTIGDTPPSIARRLPAEISEPQSLAQTGGAVLRTAANVALPAARTFTGAAALGAVGGAIGSPDDPALGAALGGTVGVAVHGSIKAGGAIGRAAGIKRSKGVPPPAALGAKDRPPIPTPQADATAVAPRSAIRDLSNSDVLGMTPKGIEIVAKQAAKEEAALLTELFGPKGARKYRSAVRRAESSVDSPETAAKALASLESMKSSLGENQQRALEEINARGFTSKRLANIAKVTKDYTPENLAKIADEDLVRQFGEVLMTKRPDRNLSGLYRLRALFGELQTRGVDDAVVTRGVYDYMTAQGIKPEGLGALIIGKMHDVRKTLAKVDPEKVQPETPAVPTVERPTITSVQLSKPLSELTVEQLSVVQARIKERLRMHREATAAGGAMIGDESPYIKDLATLTDLIAQKTRTDLGTVSEAQLQQELTDLVPPAAPAPDPMAAAEARVQAARTTPFPGATAPTETIGPAAIRTPAGKIYTAQTHLQARQLAEAAGDSQAWMGVSEADEGFVTNTGRYVDRSEAADIYETSTGRSMEAARNMKTTPGLHAYMVPRSARAAAPDIKTVISSEAAQPTGPLQEQTAKPVTPLVDAYLKETGQSLQSVLTEFGGGYKLNRDAVLRQIAGRATEREGVFGADVPIAQVEAELSALAKSSAGTFLSRFVQDETGYLDLNKLNTVVEKFKSEPEGKLPSYSKELQGEIVENYRPIDDPRLPEGWYAAFARKTMPLERAERAVARAGGKVKTRESPAANIQLLSGWAGKVHYLMKWGGFREVNGEIVPTGTPGLETILHSVKGKQKALDRYLLAARVAELDAQGRNLVTNIDPQNARLEVANASPEVAAAGQNVAALLDNVMQQGVDAGLISDRNAAVFRFLGQSYVPLARVIDGERGPPTPSATTALGVPDPFRKLRGSGLKFVSPRQAVVDYSRRVLRAAELNRVANSIVDLTNRFPEQTKGWIVERGKNAAVDASRDLDVSGKDLVKMFKEAGLELGEDSARETAALLSKRSLLMDADWMRYRDKATGEVHQVKLEPGMAEIVRSLSPQDIGLMEQFLAIGAQSVRTGVAVLDPIFAIRQVVVDAFHARMNSQFGFKMGKSTLDGMVATIKQNKDYRDFFAGGGAYSTFLPAGRGTEQTLRSITPRSGAANVAVALWNPVDTMAKLMDPLIELNKLGEFVAARRKGADVFEAALAAREVAGDLAMTGTKLAAMRRMTAFLGPYIAGTEKTFRTARERPAATLAAGIQAITIPSALLWWAATGDDGVRDLQRGEQGKNFWYVRVGPQIVKIRKPQLWGQFFGGTMEAALDQMESENPEGYVRAMEGFAKELLPPGLPNTIEVFEGLRTGVDPRTGIPIVPAARQELDPEFQFGYQTSETSKRLGELAGVSPAQIDYAIRNLTGSFGAAVLQGSDQLLGYRGVSPPSPVAADLPLLGQLFGRSPSSMAEPLTTFYKNAEQTARRLNTAKELAEKFQADKLGTYMEKHAMDIALAKGYAEARADLTKLRQFVEEVRSYPDDVMSREDKRELIDTAMEQMIERVRPWNDAVRDIRKSNKAALVGAP